ncbi:hypothetical protein BJY52DRAFT_1194172 [Lactarius psammicola]|nr:hypothetical protein BJY52DRAFT_1194172 [Lactarius psammicola]
MDIYYVLIVWSFVEFVPETYVPGILKKKAQRLRKTSGGPRYSAPIGLENFRFGKSIIINFYRTFQLLLFDRLALLIDLGNSLAFQEASGLMLTVLYWDFIRSGTPVPHMTGLTFIDPGVGVFIGLATTPYWNRCPYDVFKYALVRTWYPSLLRVLWCARTSITLLRCDTEKHGDPPPEFCLLTGQAGAVLVSGSLFYMAFTAYSHSMQWIAPIIVSIPLGTGIDFVFTSSLSYLIVAYRPVAASAIASNSATRSTFGPTFPLFN